jgi:hypothetical protein
MAADLTLSMPILFGLHARRALRTYVAHGAAHLNQIRRTLAAR